MAPLLVGIFLLAVIFLVFLFFRSEKSGDAKNTIAPTAGLSPVAKQLVKEYNELPEDNRPFPNIVELVRSLDAKHSVDARERENHFNYNYLEHSQRTIGGYEFRWSTGAYSCSHQERYCKFSEYYRLHKAIRSVKESVDAKERAVLESQHAGDTDLLVELEQRLREESLLNKQFVSHFKELS